MGSRKAPTPAPAGAVKPEAPPSPPAKRLEPRICTTCPEPHVDNCPKCFGFGVTSTGAPISAHYVTDENPPKGWKRCPVCGGEPMKAAPLLNSARWVLKCAEALVRASDPRIADRPGDPGVGGALHALGMAVRSTVDLVKSQRSVDTDETLDLDRRLR